MALVLCTGINTALLDTRRLMLESAGHTVVVATDERSLLRACKKHQFDVFVLGQSTTPKLKRNFSALIKQHCPDVKILELYQPHIGRSLEDADAWLVVPADVPRDLVDRVNELVVPREPKQFDSHAS